MISFKGFSEIFGCFLALHFTLKHNKWKWQWAGGFNILAGLIGCLGWIFSHMDSKLYYNLVYASQNLKFSLNFSESLFEGHSLDDYSNYTKNGRLMCPIHDSSLHG